MKHYLLLISVLLFSLSSYGQKMKTRDQSKDKVEKKTTIKKTSPVIVSTPSVAVAKKGNKTNSKKKTYHIKQNSNPVIEESKEEYHYLNVNETSLQFDRNGGSKTIEVNTNGEYDIIIPPASWASLKKQGNKLTLIVDANNDKKSRSDYFLIGSKDKDIRIEINQAGLPNYLSVSSENLEFDYSGGQARINIASNEYWSVSVKPALWGSYTTEANSIVLNISENKSQISRADYIKIKSGDIEKIIRITQKGREYTNNNNTASVNKNSDDMYYGYKGYNNSSSYGKTNSSHSKGRFSIGWDIVDVNAFNNTVSIGTGLRFRIGRYSDFINLITGASYCYNIYYKSFIDIIHLDKVESKGLNTQIAIPLGLNLNLFKTGRKSKFYIGCLAEYSFKLKECKNATDLSSKYSFAIVPKMGFASKHCDCGFYYKKFLNENNILKKEVVNSLNLDKGRVGFDVTVYF